MESYNALVKTAHEVSNPNPIKFRAGERIVVGKCDEQYPGWIWTTIESGNSDWAPKSCLEISSGSGLALCDYESTLLATQTGESLRIAYEYDGWAWASNQSGVAGWIPLSSIKP